MTDLIIIGAGNVGGFISYNLSEFGNYQLMGFLDDDKNKHGKLAYGKPVLGGVDQLEKYSIHKRVSVVIAISSPVSRCAIKERLRNSNVEYPNFIARNAWISDSVVIGNGVILYPGVSINYETQLGDFVIVNMNCAIGHNCTVEDFSTLAPGVNLGGFTWLESMVSVGIGASTRQNVRVGTRSVIGGQTMLIKNIDADMTVAGVPGKVFK